LRFLALPIHPLFVYDGKHKPPFKRGKAVRRSYGSAPIIHLSKTLIDIFRFPRHEAPGEAEAECARLQSAGIVDAVMSNDVDALMFGSTITVMNFSKESSSGTNAATHVTYYCTQEKHGLPANVPLSRAGMILFAMLSGGDYLPSGVPKCGSKLAAGIAKAGFGDDLLEILGSNDAEADLNLNDWRDRLQYELDENESGYFQRKHRAVRIPDAFPDRAILSYYANPVVSTNKEVEPLRQRLLNAWDHEIDALQIRAFAGDSFDWKYRSGAKKVIRQLAEPLVSYRLRLGRPVLAAQKHRSSIPNSEVPVLQHVHRSRTHYSTDGASQLQFEIVPIDVVGLDLNAEEPNPSPQQELTDTEEGEALGSAVDQAVQEPKARQPAKYNPYSPEKVWIFEILAQIGIPDIIDKWRQGQNEKAAALKKFASKSTTTKKKPIDPSMKPGGILRYATVVKPRSNAFSSEQDRPLDTAGMKPLMRIETIDECA
jgi:holliday junction resolvase YEN1